VFLVMCTRHKRVRPCEAKDLYTSPFFVLARTVASVFGRRWFILSAKYGLLKPSDWVSPYDVDLTQQTSAKRAEWDNQVVDSLLPHLYRTDRVILLADSVYGEGIETILRGKNILVYWPLQGMSHEQSIAWLASASMSDDVRDWRDSANNNSVCQE
jgi:hypothetical protein